MIKQLYKKNVIIAFLVVMLLIALFFSLVLAICLLGVVSALFFCEDCFGTNKYFIILMLLSPAIVSLVPFLDNTLVNDYFVGVSFGAVIIVVMSIINRLLKKSRS